VLRLRRGLRVLTKNGVLDAAAFVFDAVHKTTRPKRIRQPATQAKKDREPPRARRNEHDDADKKQGKTRDNAKGTTDLVERRFGTWLGANRLLKMAEETTRGKLARIHLICGRRGN